MSRGGDNAKRFITTNLVNHLKSRHSTVYSKFCENKTRKESHRLAARREKGGFTGLRQLMLQDSRERTRQWDINYPRATTVYTRDWGLDYQPISMLADVGFIRFVSALEPRYKVPSRKYVIESIIYKINLGVKEELRKRVHASGVKYYSFTTDVWSMNTATHSLLSLTAHWVESNFERISAVLCVQQLEGSHRGNAICERLNCMLDEWDIKKECVHLVLRDNATNMNKAMRDAGLTSYGCFAHSLQLVVNDGILSQRSVSDLLAICRQIMGHFKRSAKA